MGMDTERLMALLRNPQKVKNQAQRKEQAAKVKQERAERAAAKAASNKVLTICTCMMVVLVVVSLVFVLSSKNRAENISNSLDPNALKGLVVNQTFNPNKNVRYEYISAGQDRSVSNVTQYGSTLPVISRYNFKSLNKDSYNIIGEAPYALSINITSNANDPELLRYLFNRDDVAEGFFKRPEVASLVADPKAVSALVTERKKINAFLQSEAVQMVLADPKLLNAIAQSRLVSRILISPALKYYRDNPALAAKMINANPELAALKKNPHIRQAVAANNYLKKNSSILLK